MRIDRGNIMYVGIDFLISRGKVLYVSEVNTGLPAGATEYDLVYRRKHGRDSGIWKKIQAISIAAYKCSFEEHINRLPFLDDLMALKIWMDGRGRLPENPHPYLKLEDKWIQYKILKDLFPLIPAELCRSRAQVEEKLFRHGRIVLKQRMGRGGKGLRIIDRTTSLEGLDFSEKRNLIQPYIDSRIHHNALSIRAAAFAGQFLCMFASLAPRLYSNHGIRLYVSPGENLGLSEEDFHTDVVLSDSREAYLFYRGNIPDYLGDAVRREEIGGAVLKVPGNIFSSIKEFSAAISAFYMSLDPRGLPDSIITAL